MSQANEQATRSNGMTWGKLWGWMLVLYIGGMIGYFCKASQQGIHFENIWQIVAISFVPAIPFILFAIPFLIYLAIKSFRISRCGGFAQLLGTVYAVFTFFQVISPHPL